LILLLPTGRWFALLGTVSALFILAFVRPELGRVALAIDLLLVLLLLVDRWLGRKVALVATRDMPPTLYQGERTTISLDLENHERRTLSVILRETFSPALTEGALNRRARIGARECVRWSFELIPRMRGETTLAPPALRVRGPLGLAWIPWHPEIRGKVKIFPQIHLTGDAGLVLRHALERRVGANPLSSRGISTELYALREYLPGDEYRRIHWKESARLNRPITRENTWEQHQHILILLDCGRPMASLSGPYSKLDYAFSAVLALLRVIVAQQDSASLVLFSKDIRRVVRVDRRTRTFSQVFEQLYQEQADLEEPDYDATTSWCARRIPRRSLAIVCTSIQDLLSADHLAGALDGLARRHRPLLVNLEDPGLVNHAHSIPHTLLDAYAKVSAMSLVAANQRLTKRLRGRGIAVIATPASRLAIGMIQSYLDHKSRRLF